VKGLVLFAHGARDPRWAAPFEAVAEALRAARPGLQVRLAFLEFMAPTLAEAGAALAAAGCTRVVVLPMFLGAGGHVRQDLPRQLDALRAAHPALAFELAGAIGEQPEVLAAMAAAALRSLDAA
jgi:sirohydrochlorin cobaltochelatase